LGAVLASAFGAVLASPFGAVLAAGFGVVLASAFGAVLAAGFASVFTPACAACLSAANGFSTASVFGCPPFALANEVLSAFAVPSCCAWSLVGAVC
jgi:hypothetical protein